MQAFGARTRLELARIREHSPHADDSQLVERERKRLGPCAFDKALVVRTRFQLGSQIFGDQDRHPARIIIFLDPGGRILGSFGLRRDDLPDAGGQAQDQPAQQ